ncbi:MAG: STAS-like domain-containing protein [Candidatus Eremiobacteraeota bacterium]|nr:STAS-like domain-containing protein [Candidatus Eremiobacteraeota bacterium]MCW5869244.1 STAS-like domain-containing protein [Candidatus Eremiobacteraeota bacterium]
MDVTDRLAALEAENANLREKMAQILDRMEYLEDSLDAHIGLQEFKEAGEPAVPFSQLAAEMNSVFISVRGFTGEFAENKEVAAQLREDAVRPALTSGQRLTIDFAGVEMATQGFVHALLADVIRALGSDVLDLVTFENCCPVVQSVVKLVVEYSQGGSSGN